MRRVLSVIIILALWTPLYGETNPEDAGVAEKYAAWILSAMEEDRWGEAEEALKRAEDFNFDSSDLSYLSALVLSHQNRSRRLVLDALNQALELNKWDRYNPDAARLLQAETHIALRAFPAALESLSRIANAALDIRGFGRPAIPPGVLGNDTSIGSDIAYLRLRALLGMEDFAAFREALSFALERYSWDTRPVRLLFQYGARKDPEEADRPLIDLALRRLPALLPGDPALAYLAIPFLNEEEGRRYLSSYRAVGGGARESLGVSLNLGIIDDERAIEELFSPPYGVPGGLTLDRALVLEIYSLLRHDIGREAFSRNLNQFSGVITDDRDRDGFPESRIQYRDGAVQNFSFDGDQDGKPELHILFQGGIPIWGETVSEIGEDGTLVYWERYPWVSRAVFEGRSYAFRPRELAFTPVKFSELGPMGLQFPLPDSMASGLTKNTLASFAAAVERPSGEFEGAVERIELARGLPLRAAEYLEGRTVSVTEYLFGGKYTQRIDLDLDGRLETTRKFRRPLPEEEADEALFDWNSLLESSESDWDGDGVYETGEEYHADGAVILSWDLNYDGVKEYTLRK